MTLVELPAFQDAHVHLALIDPSTLVAGGLSRVVDLGGWLPAAAAAAATVGPQPHVTFAGQFLTAPGGYPSQQAWAPAGSSREVTSAADAASAVDQQADAGASLVKVALNSVTGPVLQAEVLAAIVSRAHQWALPVVAHAEGAGQALAAHLAGVEALAHTPFTERLPDDLVAAMAKRMTWISTLDIHGRGAYGDDFDRATDNLRRFNAQGGRVLYGTDLGNGPLPIGLNRREIEALQGAGLSPKQIIAALCADGIGRAAGPRTATATGARTGTITATAIGTNTAVGPTTSTPPPLPPGEPLRTTVLPMKQPADPAEFAAWLCTARALTATEREDLR